MRRFLLTKLVEWKNRSTRKPLLLNGARQVGKTWLLKEFGKKYFDDYLYVSLDTDQDARRLFQTTTKPSDIIKGLELLYAKKVAQESTLVIIDEIQTEPKALMSLKYFCDDNSKYAVCSAGSLLGLSTNFGSGYPVGKVNTFNLYPLTFAEYLCAVGDERLFEYLADPDNIKSSNFCERAISRLREYMFVGGMPEVVSTYISNEDFDEVRTNQLQIIEDYTRDFVKHADVRTLPRLLEVWDSIPQHLSQENKKFVFGRIREGARAKNYENALIWLDQAGLINKIKRVKKPELPLSAFADGNAFKVFLHDIGILGAMCGVTSDLIVKNNVLFSQFNGALTEQFVCQQLVSAKGLTPYYWSAENSSGEIDFLVENMGEITAIEVKSGTSVRSKSLRAFHDKYPSTHATRFSLCEYEEQDWMRNFELYKIISKEAI